MDGTIHKLLLLKQTDESWCYLQKGVTAMGKRNIVIHYLVILILIATFVACASTSKQESTGEYVDDSVITTKVKSLLAGNDFKKSSAASRDFTLVVMTESSTY